MLGKPIYKYEEEVKFKIHISDDEEVEKSGTIAIIDRYGTFEEPEDVSYDVMVTEDDGSKCLYKHITEKLLYK